MTLHLSIKDTIVREVSQYFDPKCEVKKRIRVVADTHIFTTEDKSVWEQKKGLAPNWYQVYFDDQFIISFQEGEHRGQVMLKFWKNFVDLYKKEEVRATPPWYKTIDTPDQLQEKEEDPEKVLKNYKASTPAQKMAKEVVTRLVKDKKTKKKLQAVK